MILCCGEALIDMIPEPTESGAMGFVPHTGGAVFNTAIGLGRLGADVGFCSGISTDTFGALLKSTLAENQVSSDLLVLSDRLTTLAIVHLKDGQATYSFYDDNSAGRMITPMDMPKLPSDVTALYFGGISLVAEPAADAYACVLASEGKGRVVMIDPNIRPGFITNEAAYRNRLSQMIAGSDIVKVSDEDLDWIVPCGDSHIEKARDLIAKGPHVVLVTQGADGAMAITQNDDCFVPSERATVVDTVGAGDTFNSGFLAQLQSTGSLVPEKLRGLAASDFQDALAFGAKVAAVTVSRAGANPPWAAELSDDQT